MTVNPCAEHCRSSEPHPETRNPGQECIPSGLVARVGDWRTRELSGAVGPCRPGKTAPFQMLSSGVYSIDPFYPVRFSIEKYGVVNSTSARCLLDRVPGMVFSLCLLLSSTHAEIPLPDVERLKTSPVLQHLKPNPMPSPPRTPGEQTLAQMYLPEGFRAALIVSEPDIRQPVAFAFDERGRIWVAEAFSYPTRRPSGQGLDKIIILEDRDGDGRFETRKIFAEGLNLISGLELGHGGVWVGAAPELLVIADRNGDDVPDGPG